MGDASCTEVEGVFLHRLGLTWTDAVALLGGHTIGRGSADFSGHDGIWVETEEESVIFDKGYYEEILRRAWIPRNQNDPDIQDWTWGGRNGESPRFMLNADLCLVFDIETTFPCCTNVDRFRDDGTNQCDRGNSVLSDTPCGTYPPNSPREEAQEAIYLFAQPRDQGGFRDDNGPFFDAFATAWNKATTNGWTDLQPIAASCTSSNPTAGPIGVLTSAPTDEPTNHPTASQNKEPSQAPATSQPTPSPVQTPNTGKPTTSPTRRTPPNPTQSPTRTTRTKATKNPTPSPTRAKATKNTKTAKRAKAGTATNPFQ